MASTDTAAITGGKLLVDCLINLGAKKCFGVPGESYLDILDALHDTRGQLDYILCRNESGAAFMAEAWSRITGVPGICMVTRGPGATNASIGIHSAMQASTPMLVLVGQVGTDQQGREAFQELDYTHVFGGIAKWVVEIRDSDRIPELLSRAWTTACGGRPGPVVIALPENMLVSKTLRTPCNSVTIASPAPASADIERASAMLADARQPIVLVGGGRWDNAAKHSLRQFVESGNLPVATAFRYHDLIDNHYHGYIGNAGVGMSPALKSALQSADLLLAIGVRFGEMTTDAWQLYDLPNPSIPLIHVHPSSDEIGKIYAADLPILATPGQFCASMAERPAVGNWREWSAGLHRQYLELLDLSPQPCPVDMTTVMQFLQRELPDDAILTNGAGNFAIWPNRYFRFGNEQRLLAPQSGAMGYGLPAAIAAKLAFPEKTVVCIAGDGDFQMTCQELGTAMQAGACPIILILNNCSYGTIRMHQERHYPDRVSATTLENPDFARLASAYGFHAERVETTQGFPDAFGRAMSSSSGAVLELVTDVEALTPTLTLSRLRSAT